MQKDGLSCFFRRRRRQEVLGGGNVNIIVGRLEDARIMRTGLRPDGPFLVVVHTHVGPAENSVRDM